MPGWRPPVNRFSPACLRPVKNSATLRPSTSDRKINGSQVCPARKRVDVRAEHRSLAATPRIAVSATFSLRSTGSTCSLTSGGSGITARDFAWSNKCAISNNTRKTFWKEKEELSQEKSPLLSGSRKRQLVSPDNSQGMRTGWRVSAEGTHLKNIPTQNITSSPVFRTFSTQN